MAYDKAVDSTQLDADLTTVADAIRTKGGTTATLAFPNGFASAIAAISTGGGGSDLAGIEVYVADYYVTDDLSVTIGALDKYKRIIVS